MQVIFKAFVSLLMVSAMLMATPSWANQNPRALATDSRIKIVAYNPDDVVTVIGSPFINTAIQFAEDESILSIQSGDVVAWETTVDKQTPNVFYVKPKLPSSSTNMAVMTTKRHYDFHLITRSDMVDSKAVTYRMEFKYPAEEQAALSQALSNLQRTFLGAAPGNPNPVYWNYNYSFFGARNLAPIQAVDNGAFTILKFRYGAPIPAIFAVDRYRHESLLNFKVQGNFVFIQGVRRQLTLRNGADVTTIYNDSVRG